MFASSIGSGKGVVPGMVGVGSSTPTVVPPSTPISRAGIPGWALWPSVFVVNPRDAEEVVLRAEPRRDSPEVRFCVPVLYDTAVPWWKKIRNVLF